MNIEQILKDYDYVVETVAKKFASRDARLEWEDLAQECRIRIFEKLRLIDPQKIKKLEAFIRTLCTNCCINYIRDEGKRFGKDLVYIEDYKHELGR